jgi:hypothetical protein
MVGQYNPSITQRLNGLADKKQLEHKGLNIQIVEVDEDSIDQEADESE